MSQSSSVTSRRPARRYLRAPVPIHFPAGEHVPETGFHTERKRLLWESVRSALGSGALVSSDQFLYWDATNPRKCLAPDLAVRVGAPRELLDSWKTWERGAPHVAVEIVSDWDASEKVMGDKLERYRQAGIPEVVRFDPTEPADQLRIWDLVDGDLVERDPTDPEARRCDALGLYWVVRHDAEIRLTLRLARDPRGNDLLLTPAEAERAAKEVERAAKEAEQAAKEAAMAAKDEALAAKDEALAAKNEALRDRDAALARIAALEAELSAKR
ncbi:MAG TPA: Uma2 family endonuclease [Polyangiaceae bacterium]